jgi:hypothetical protein
VPRLAARSTLAANTVVLQIIRQALHGAYAAGPASARQLSGAVASIFHWGGVYTQRATAVGSPLTTRPYWRSYKPRFMIMPEGKTPARSLISGLTLA